jgi:DNA-binding MarR family transcriptional regulator
MSFRNPTPEETDARFAALLAGPIVTAPADEGAAPADLPLLLRLANARVEHQLRRATTELGCPGLSPAAIHAMRVCSHGGKRLVSIADHLLVSRQAAAQVVDRLEKDGLVERTPTARGPLVMQTDEGRELAREVNASLTEIIEAWLVQLRGDRLEQLCSDLEVLTEPPGARWRNLGD